MKGGITLEGIVSRILGTIVAIVMLFVVALESYLCLNTITATRKIMNETVNFIDKVTDTGLCTDDNLEDFYLACTGYGVPVDVKVTRQESIVNPVSKEAGSGTRVTYMVNSDNTVYNQGDIVVVDVKFLSDNSLQKFLWNILRVLNFKQDYTFAGMVRH